ncbi:hypothetical protein N9S74_02360 [Pelagibacteraceae bacterium]|jgi:hypothetical protein|nr:hypothetical protein [Pelagibacteraceae bacterium]
MNSENNPKNKRPYRMINVAFPPAKYGVFAAIIIIFICSILIFFR